MARKASEKASSGIRRYSGPPLTREIIIDTAIGLIDSDGLESFSLRTLANKLGVYPTAIYWHIPNRNELVALVASRILANIAPQKKRRSWQQHLRDLFHNFRDAIRAHPNAAPLIGTELVSNTNVELSVVESVLSALTRAGLTGPLLVGAYNSVVAAMVGFVAQEFAPMPAEDTNAWQLSVQEHLLTVDRTLLPTLAETMPLLCNRAFILRWQNGIDAPLDDSFSIHVEVTIGGIEALVRHAEA